MDDERRNALTVSQMVRLLDCPEEVVVNMVGQGRQTPLSTDPPTFSSEEAWRGERECDRRRKALEEIIRLSEGLE